MEIKGITSDEVETQASTSDRKSTRKRSILIFTVISILNVGLLALLWTQLLTPASNLPKDTGPSLGGDISSPLIGKAAPDFNLPTVTEKSATIQLSALKGKPVILNFWASSCNPCNDETPFLQKSWLRLKEQGVVLIGIDGPEKDNRDALQFLQKYGVTYQNIKDSTDGATAIKYGVVGFPETFFINRQGVIVARWISPLTEEGLQREMAKMLQ